MSSIIPSPSRGAVSSVATGNGLALASGTLSMGAASTSAPGAMSAADKAKVDALTGTNTGDVSLDGTSSNWLTLVGQVLKLTLVAASDVAQGLVTTAAQTFAGVKTFTSAIVASAGVQVATLFNANGSLAADVSVKVGTTLADASVNTNATIFMVATGIGTGSEVQRLGVRTNSQGTGFVLFGVGTNGSLVINNSVGTQLVWANNIITVDGSNFTFANQAYGNIVRIAGAGSISYSGTDSSGAPGAATINKPSGKSAIPSGASSVVITNSLVATGDQVFITWHGDHGQARDWVTTAAGSFTVNLNAAASANTAFCWTVSKRI